MLKSQENVCFMLIGEKARWGFICTISIMCKISSPHFAQFYYA